MKRALFLVALLPSMAFADKHRDVVLVQPYAVPVAVPVSTYSPYMYSSSQAQQQAYSSPPRSAEDVLADRLAEKIAGRLGMPLAPKAAQLPPTMFSLKCAGCHAKGNPDLGKPAFTTIDSMPNDLRLKAIDDIVSDVMPKGGKLNPDEAAKLIKEFVTKPKAVAAEPLPSSEQPPPPPQTEEIQK